MGEITARRAATRERLIDAAKEVLADRGLQGATVESICERAGYSRGAFYSNFGSREQLMRALFAQETQRKADALAEAAAPPVLMIDGMESLAQAFEQYMHASDLTRQEYLVQREFVTHAVRQPELAAMCAAMWVHLQQDVADVLEKASATLGVPLRVPARDAARIVMGAYDVAMRDHLLSTTASDVAPGALTGPVMAALRAVLGTKGDV